MIALYFAGAGCATLAPPAVTSSNAQPRDGFGVLRSIEIGHPLEDRILAMDPKHISATDVVALAAGPTPRILLLRGGFYPVQRVMQSFGEFLVGMGYPAAKIRDPANGEWSYSPYDSAERLAGVVAWYYEHDGMRPMVVGHSQGGVYAVKILKELAGHNSNQVSVRNPLTDTNENRSTITDPLTGNQRPVIGTSVAYASAIGAGGWALLLPNQWENPTTLWTIPDSVDEFTGYFIRGDFFALSFPDTPLASLYKGSGTTVVRTVVLPANYSHITAPATRELAEIPEVRDWINAFVPESAADPSLLPGDAPLHALWAADVWYSIKKGWCVEAQRLIRAKRALHAQDARVGNGTGIGAPAQPH